MKNYNQALQLLRTRRSVKAAELLAPGPDMDQLQDILTIAARVPDHGKTMPFYFVVFEGEGRAKIGDVIADVFAENDPVAEVDKIEVERARFMRAPLVVAVVYRARRGKHPLWEQMMSAGAVCQNLLLAAHAHGFAGQWLTEWYAYDDTVRAALGLDDRDVVAGFVYIGSPPAELPQDRDRPDLAEIVTRYDGCVPLNKGDVYDRDKFPFPRVGVDFKLMG